MVIEVVETDAGFTVTVIDAVAPFLVRTVILAVPVAFAVRLPFAALTDTTAELLELQQLT